MAGREQCVQRHDRMPSTEPARRDGAEEPMDELDPDQRNAAPTIRRAALTRWLPGLLFVASLLVAPAFASAGPSDDLLRQGAAAYQAVCSACHQPGGVGISGQYPPLIDNPNIEDAAYIEEVIRNGRTGPLEVDGVTYDGVMPAQSTVSDSDIEAIIAYIQSGFAVPEGPVPEAGTGSTAGTELPLAANWTYLLAFAAALAVGGIVLAPRLTSAHDGRSMPWLDAWLKTAVIVVGMIVATTIVPAWVIETDAVRELPRLGQDLITAALWALGLGGGLLALWYAHREKRI
jgi:mono/diheme cytochrome c family protein